MWVVVKTNESYSPVQAVFGPFENYERAEAFAERCNDEDQGYYYEAFEVLHG